jgi:hypothetical protein
MTAPATAVRIRVEYIDFLNHTATGCPQPREARDTGIPAYLKWVLGLRIPCRTSCRKNTVSSNPSIRDPEDLFFFGNPWPTSTKNATKMPSRVTIEFNTVPQQKLSKIKVCWKNDQ